MELDLLGFSVPSRPDVIYVSIRINSCRLLLRHTDTGVHLLFTVKSINWILFDLVRVCKACVRHQSNNVAPSQKNKLVNVSIKTGVRIHSSSTYRNKKKELIVPPWISAHHSCYANANGYQASSNRHALTFGCEHNRCIFSVTFLLTVCNVCETCQVAPKVRLIINFFK